MIKYVAISLIAIFLMACTGNKNSYFSEEEKEDSNAKEMLQGIWLDDETESFIMPSSLRNLLISPVIIGTA